MKKLILSCWLVLASTTHGFATPLSASKTADMRIALDDLSLALADNGYQLIKVQTIDQALVKRGYADPGIRLAFIGKEAHIQQALASNPALLNLLPLRLTLETDGQHVRISSDDLTSWRERFPETNGVVQGWEDELAAILADYANQ
ncbi:MAG: hypothetical protein ABL892_02235 [Thiobacillaceae bacterium]